MKEKIWHGIANFNYNQIAQQGSIGYFVNNEKEVDLIMEKVKNAGAQITKTAQKALWGGYHGYFQDLDGHLWEIGYNPSWKIED